MAKNWRKKRLSNLILLSTVLFYILVYILLIVMTRTGIQWSLKNGTTGSTPVSDDTGEVLYPYTGFRFIDLEGRWDVSVISGSEYTVMVDMGAAKPKGTRVAKNGETLVMKNPDKERTLTAMIIVPSLERISAKGQSMIAIDGFTPENFQADLSDDCRLGADNCHFVNLKVRAVDNAVIDFDDAPAVNADVALSGSSVTEILMDGGDLTGRVTGRAELIPSGQTGSDSIRTGGEGKVTRNP